MDQQKELKREIAKHYGYNYHRAIAAFDKIFQQTFDAIWAGGDLVLAKEMEHFIKAWH